MNTADLVIVVWQTAVLHKFSVQTYTARFITAACDVRRDIVVVDNEIGKIVYPVVNAVIASNRSIVSRIFERCHILEVDTAANTRHTVVLNGTAAVILHNDGSFIDVTEGIVSDIEIGVILTHDSGM